MRPCPATKSIYFIRVGFRILVENQKQIFYVNWISFLLSNVKQKLKSSIFEEKLDFELVYENNQDKFECDKISARDFTKLLEACN